MDTDRNLLFGVLALQLDLIDPQQFSEACASWATQKERALADLLVARGWIAVDDRQAVARLLERKLRKHDGNAQQTLGDVAGSAARAVLHNLDVPSIRASLDGLPPIDGAAKDSAKQLGSTQVTPTEELPRYSLTRLHAEGGLGRIFIAHDKDLNREVALKEIKPQQAQLPEARRRFLTEAQVTGQLEHPNIVPVYELSRHTAESVPFYTMRLVRGQTLRDAIADYHRRRRASTAEPLELPRLLGAFVDICQAIAYAHSRGVIHRDLKPDNVLLGSFGEVVVLDWGLAKTVDQVEEDSEASRIALTDEAKSDGTLAGRVLGTPAYMAPEQAEGRLDLIDARTDIYGLGAILFEILTGQPPHDGQNSAEVLRRTIAGPSPQARNVEPTAPAALEAICSRAMAKARSQRYARAAEVAADIQRYLADEPVSVHRETVGSRLTRWLRQHRTWTMTAAATAAAVLITTALAAVRLSRLADQERSARVAAEQMREEGMQVAAKFAARTLAGEIDLRWRILEGEADDPALRRLLPLVAAGGKPRTHPEWKSLEAWLQGCFDKHAHTTKAASWFLTDDQGIQLVRAPLADTVGHNYAFRDYFHGQRRDFKPTEAVGLKPIRDVHRSIVFESQATSSQMVAFSVPVWSGDRGGDQPDARVLGVLSMTVELGRFSVLHLSLGKDQVAVLVDTKEDWTEGPARKGLILHHPYLAELRAEQKDGQRRELPIFRLDAAHVRELEQLRAQRLRLDRRQEDQEWNAPGAYDPLPGSVDRDYHDPVGGDYAGTWVAVFEPVLIRGRSDRIKDTGWVIIIQERLDATRATSGKSS